MCESGDPAWPPTSSRRLFPPLQCDDMVGGLPPPLAVLGELKPPQRQNLMAFLQLVGCSVQGECPGLQGVVSNQKLFSTAYFLVSALAGMGKRNFIPVVALRLLLLWKTGPQGSPPSGVCGG